jgi:serine/threonine protein kinase
VCQNEDKESCERTLFYNKIPRSSEDILTEVGIFCYLSQQKDLSRYLLKMHCIFQSSEDSCLVLDFAEGGDLCNFVQNGFALGEFDFVQGRARELVQAITYLHQHCIGHRDVSLENVLLQNGEARLMDFGQAVLTQRQSGQPLRYFRGVGKPYYRPPECFIPAEPQVWVNVPEASVPCGICFVATKDGGHLCEVLLPSHAEPGGECVAEAVGYTVPPIDVFACGVCIFSMLTGMPPWKEATSADGHFNWVRKQGDKGIRNLFRIWKKSVPRLAEDLIVQMLRTHPSERLRSSCCLEDPWFAQSNQSSTPQNHAQEISCSVLQGDLYRSPEVQRCVVLPETLFGKDEKLEPIDAIPEAAVTSKANATYKIENCETSFHSGSTSSALQESNQCHRVHEPIPPRSDACSDVRLRCPSSCRRRIANARMIDASPQTLATPVGGSSILAASSEKSQIACGSGLRAARTTRRRSLGR